MSHKKGQGSTRNGRDSNGQRRGVKKYGGEANRLVAEAKRAAVAGDASTACARPHKNIDHASDGVSGNSARFGKFTRSRNQGFATVSTKTGRAPPVLFKVPRCRTR